MTEVTRRNFMAGVVAAVTAAKLPEKSVLEPNPSASFEKNLTESATSTVHPEPIDFRFAPRHWQTAICFPDDPKKSLVGQQGDIRYGFAKSLFVGMEDFSTVCTFGLAGMQDDQVQRQWLESPSIPIVHTLIERHTAQIELIAFASRRPNEGRVDNVLIKITPKQKPVSATPKIHIRTCEQLSFKNAGRILAITNESSGHAFLLAAKMDNTPGSPIWWEEAGYTIYLAHGEATPDQPLQYLVRLPQEGQSLEALAPAFDNPRSLLEESRQWWSAWKPFESVEWSYPGSHGAFLTACARNIQQAREVKNNRLVFQVGPTVYRGLWIVDGNFLLEAARYLGYDKEADEGLRSEWSKQLPSGQVVAAVPGEHWKDTAIAMFTLVRQCELKQDWSDFRELEPNVRRAIEFLKSIRDDAAKNATTTNGKYALLPPGFADGGIDGVRSEFTNTVWTLAGLKAVATAAQQLNMPSLQLAETFYKDLRASFLSASRQEMVKHPGGFEYLPMLAHDDSLYQNPDPWQRPRPQSAQWALSHSIFPGGVFDPSDAIVKGHIALLQSCTQEDIPAETGWLWHEAVWNYNASFAAHVYLWAGLSPRAERTFAGFLNHASPLYCWREEQPLQNALVGQDWGDMPHNWASAECIRYLRHRLVLEDGSRLRLLEGISQSATELKNAYALKQTPTRFGRVDLQIEPTDSRTTVVTFSRTKPGTKLDSIELPAALVNRKLANIENANHRLQQDKIFVDPESKAWKAIYR
jgi:hypothetical protein